MATHTVAQSDIAKHGITLTAGVVDTVTFTSTDAARVQLFSNGAAEVYFTVDGSTPTVGGANCYLLPAVASVDDVEPPTGGATVVKLISSGTPTLSVVRR